MLLTFLMWRFVLEQRIKTIITNWLFEGKKTQLIPQIDSNEPNYIWKKQLWCLHVCKQYICLSWTIHILICTLRNFDFQLYSLKASTFLKRCKLTGNLQRLEINTTLRGCDIFADFSDIVFLTLCFLYSEIMKNHSFAMGLTEIVCDKIDKNTRL